MIAGFRIEEQIGRGATSVVYRARQLALDRNVALKLLAPEVADAAGFRGRFLRESRLAASLEHPNIVPVYDAGESVGLLYVVMRHVEGRDLRRLIRAEGALEPARALALVEQVASALDAAHVYGLVHRDVKPSNILVTAGDDHVYLTDFGLTQTAADPAAAGIVGTIDYVAPEQVEGAPVDGRADVYSLACVLQECLTGEPPFRRDSDLAVLWAHLQESPPAATVRRPELPPAIDGVLARALAKDPGDRYATCGELTAAARRVLLPERRRRLAVVGAVLVAAAVAAASAWPLLTGGGVAPLSTVDSLARVDPEANRLTAALDVGNEPTAVAVGPVGVWVAKFADRTVSRVDPRGRRVAETAPLSGPAGTQTASFPTALAVTDGGIWVGSSDGRLLDYTGGRTAVKSVQLRTRAPVIGIVATGPQAWAITTDGTLWRVTDQGAIRVTARVALPVFPTVLVRAYGSLWVTSGDGTLLRIDPSDARIAGLRRLGFAPAGLAAGARSLWLADRARGALVRLDAAGRRMLRVDGLPDAHAPAVGFGSVWVATRSGIARVDAESGRAVATIRVGPRPTALAAGAGAIWVTVLRR